MCNNVTQNLVVTEDLHPLPGSVLSTSCRRALTYGHVFLLANKFAGFTKCFCSIFRIFCSVQPHSTRTCDIARSEPYMETNGGSASASVRTEIVWKREECHAIYDDCQGYQLAIDLRSYQYHANSYFRSCCLPSNLIKTFPKRLHIMKEIHIWTSWAWRPLCV
jgi:hypothetical protein